MELLKLSKFKLQLKALISEVKQLKEQERSAGNQVQLIIQNQKRREEELGRKIAELQADLGLSNEMRQQLEKKVNVLETENSILENKQKELNGTIAGLLQSKDSFIQVYEDSFGGMKRGIEERDRKLSILSEKIRAHTLLFDTIEKDAGSIKQVVDNAVQFIKEREEVGCSFIYILLLVSLQLVRATWTPLCKLRFHGIAVVLPFLTFLFLLPFTVAGFKQKMDEVLTWEKIFFEKINNLESQLKGCQKELKRKDNHILVMESQLEAASFSEDFNPRVDELQNALSAKELIINNLVLEKQVLQFEVGNLGFAMKRFQAAMSSMNDEDKKAFSSALDAAEESIAICGNEVNCMEDVGVNEDIPHCNYTSIENAVVNSVEAASPECQKLSTPTVEPLQEECGIDSTVSEAAFLAQSACSQLQFTTNAVRLSPNGAKDTSAKSPERLDSHSRS